MPCSLALPDVGAEEVETDGEPFEETMSRLVAQLNGQFAESERLEEAIRLNLRGLGHGGALADVAADGTNGTNGTHVQSGYRCATPRKTANRILNTENHTSHPSHLSHNPPPLPTRSNALPAAHAHGGSDS